MIRFLNTSTEKNTESVQTKAVKVEAYTRSYISDSKIQGERERLQHATESVFRITRPSDGPDRLPTD